MNKPLLVDCYGLSEVSYTNLGEAETAVQALANCRFLRLQRMEDLPPGFFEQFAMENDHGVR
jgi:hypothetical protein